MHRVGVSWPTADRAGFGLGLTMWIALPCAASAASMMPSVSVGCGWIGEADVFERRAHLERDHAFADQRFGLRRDDVHAEQQIALRIADEFDEAVGFVHRARAAARGERKLADAHFVAFGFGFFLGEADGRDFRIGVDAVRHRDRIERRRLVAGDHFGRDDALLHRAVREQRLAGDVADREDVRHLRAQLRIDGDEAFVVGRKTGGLSRLSVSVTGRRPTATSTMSNSRVSSLPSGAVAVERRLDGLAALFDRPDLRVEHDLDALLLENASERLGDLEIGAGENLRQRFDHQHLRADARVDGRELEADHAAADDEQRSSECASSARRRRS